MRTSSGSSSALVVVLLVLWDTSGLGVSSFSAARTYVRSSGDSTVTGRSGRKSRPAVATADLRTDVRPSKTKKDTTKEALEELGIDLPDGLQNALHTNGEVFRKHIWILDNSGSMNLGDGKQQNLLQSVNDAHATKDCTRWGEVQEMVNCHAQLAAALGAPTDFKLLNPPKKGGSQTFRVGYCGRRRLPFANPFAKRLGGEQKMKDVLAKTKPAGSTPLPTCIDQVRSEVESMLPQLQAEGSKVSIVIATDGCNYNVDNIGSGMTEEERNQELVEALESLQDLPVSVVIRLCTDYQPIVDFYKALDQRVDWDLSLDVLDDHKSESKEVHEHNPWLNYALLLHRMRELGHYHPVLDKIDERPLTPREVRDFCRLLFGKYHFSTTSLDEGDEEDEEWAIRLLEEISAIQEQPETRKHWNPQTNTVEPWIDIEELAYKLLDEEQGDSYSTQLTP